jgi:hypothetical protein
MKVDDKASAAGRVKSFLAVRWTIVGGMRIE